MNKFINLLTERYIEALFILSAGAFFISLYFSNVMDLSPCILCWYQRILFYPIFFLSAAALAFKEKLSPKFILALALPGLVLAFYHYGIQKLGFPEGFVPCVSGNSCDEIDLEYLGFVTIPLMSLIGFLAVSILSFLKLKKNREYS